MPTPTPNTLRVCIIDDEPLAAQLIESYVGRTPFLELVGVFGSAQEAIKTVINDNIDIIFLDINLPQLNGMEFARIIPSSCKVIFTTAYENYAIEGFKVNAIDYLLKPVSYEDFLAAASKALRQLTKPAPVEPVIDPANRYIIVKSVYKLQQIPVRDILYIEGLKDYVKIYIDGEPKQVMTLMNLRTLEQALPSSMFMRVHRSFIVNLTKIRIIERRRILFGNVSIPISESYGRDFNDYITARLVGASKPLDD